MAELQTSESELLCRSRRLASWFFRFSEFTEQRVALGKRERLFGKAFVLRSSALI